MKSYTGGAPKFIKQSSTNSAQAAQKIYAPHLNPKRNAGVPQALANRAGNRNVKPGVVGRNQ